MIVAKDVWFLRKFSLYNCPMREKKCESYARLASNVIAKKLVGKKTSL